MAAKVPVIASHCGGISELVEDGITGFLFETGNSRHLAEKMNEFIKNPHKIKEFGVLGYKRIKEYSIKDQVQKLVRIYNHIPLQEKENTPVYTTIICHGKTFDPECAEVFNFFSKIFNSAKLRFIMSDWFDEDQVKEGRLFWIVDGHEDILSGWIGLSDDLPLLVPEKIPELKKLCMKFNCGLFYQGSLDAGVAIEFMMNNDSQRLQMAKNGKKSFFYLTQSGLGN